MSDITIYFMKCAPSDKTNTIPRLLVIEEAAMADVLVLLDSSSCVKYCSDTSSTVLGLSPEEVVGQLLPEFLLNKLAHVATEESINALLQAVRCPSDTVTTVEITCSGSEPKEYVATVFPLSTALEDVMAGLAIRDITEEREIQRRRDTFIAVLSHELRDPITAMMGFTRLLLETSSLSPTQREWLENIETCGQRLTAITCDMQDVVGIRTGNLTVSLWPVDLRSVIYEVLPLINETYGGLDCSVTIQADLPPVMADRSRLAQILGNLLSNAVKYSPRGGPVRICAHDEPEQRRVVVAVSDQGMGMAPEELEKIFTPFQRSQRPEARGVKGAGLGLYIVRGLVELMGGELWVDSEVGRGSTFYLALPTSLELSGSRPGA